MMESDVYGNLKIFATPVFKGSVPNSEELNKHLLNNEVIQKNLLHEKKNYHGKFSTSFNTHNYGNEDDIPHIERLSSFIIEGVKHYVSENTHPNEPIFPEDITIEDLWFNSCKKGEYQEIHNHLLYREVDPLSFIYYLKLPEGSNENTVFVNDNRKMENFFFPNLKLTQSIFTPHCKEGDFIIFPSFIEHYVRHNTSDEERITIAGNINLHYPDMVFDI